MTTNISPSPGLDVLAQSSQDGMDRRIAPRYRVDANVRAFVEHRFVRHAGRIIDLSVGGFRMSTPTLPKVDIPSNDRLDLDFGEIDYQGKHIGGFGHIVHYKQTASGLEIGFAWDANVMVCHHDQINQLTAHLIENRRAGSVSRMNGVVVMSGYISDALAGDLLAALNGHAGHILISECSTIGHSGVDMLTDMIRRGFRVEYRHPEIQYILSRVVSDTPAACATRL